MGRDALLKFYPKGTSIVLEGSTSQEVYLIKMGRVEIVKNTKAGKKVLAELGPNEIFGEMALVENRPRSASVVAMLDTECFVINPNIFEQKLNDVDPFMRSIFRVMSNTIRKLSKEKADMADFAP